MTMKQVLSELQLQVVDVIPQPCSTGTVIETVGSARYSILIITYDIARLIYEKQFPRHRIGDAYVLCVRRGTST
ncbi:hypothetical protein F2P81_001270 [Scophthalmus maximus]|uniref:Uncharacterized protein n=1 Tax=Scophthalmus maximus TaxID=52904 RepID=A0A6A4TL70_SCOMX|nr:hypothetical protein F2P81_001270 [Scophthalmus maximus]